jgi:glutaredoxin
MAFFWRSSKPASMPYLAQTHVIMYTRNGCHLCDEAWRLLEAEQARHGFSLEAVDIDSDPKLRAEYDTCVPVVTVNGKLRFRGKINPHLVRRLFEAEARSVRGA